jgi:hypothetical protein
MRKLRCYDIHGDSVTWVLQEFNERRDDFKVSDKDIVSVSTRNASKPVELLSGAGVVTSSVIVTIFYWSDK